VAEEMNELTTRTLTFLDLKDEMPNHISGKGSEYIKARAASREASRVQTQKLRQEGVLSEIETSSSSKQPPVTTLGERYNWNKTVSPRNTSTIHLAFEEARSREWVAQVEAAYAEQKARDYNKKQKYLTKEVVGLPLASVRHVPTRYGFTSGRCTGPLPSQTFQLSLSEHQYEIETLLNARKFWRFGDFLQNRDSAKV
jgi:hypothetical protein